MMKRARVVLEVRGGDASAIKQSALLAFSLWLQYHGLV